MTFAVPFFAWAAAGVALATVALHLLAWRRPPETPLPTARFAPERPIRMVSRAVRPSDLGLLALRLLLILLIGAALAGPVLAPRREGTARVIVMDRTRSAGSGDEVGAAARNAFRTGDAVIVFDSTAREVVSPTADSVTAAIPSRATSSLSAALIVASRAAHRLARDRDSVAMVIVSSFTTDQLDAAAASIRRTWPGPVQLVRAGVAPNDTAPPARPELRSPGGDPVAVAVSLAGALPGGRRVRIVRDAVTAADSAWASAGNAIVAWPIEAPAAWPRRATTDTAFGVATLGVDAATVVAPFSRVASPPAGRVTARWSDGDPAVTEATLGTGCIRSVSVPVPAVGDLAVTPAFRRFVEQIAAPCADSRVLSLASDSLLSRTLPAELATDAPARAVVVDAAESRRTLVAWLLALALAAGVAELFLRRGASHAAA
jgi:hypothetical protein